MLHDVFISFSSKDLKEVKTINNYLSAGDDALKCWFSDGNISAGQAHTSIVPENLNEASVFLLVLSKNSWDSEYVQNEIAMAKNKNKVVIPVQIDKSFDTSKIIYLFGDKQVETIYNWTPEELDKLKIRLQKALDEIKGSPWYEAHAEELEALERIEDEKKKKAERERIQREREEKEAKARAKRKAEYKVIVKDLEKFKKSISEKIYGEDDDDSEIAAAKRLKKNRNIFIAAVAIIVAILALVGFIKDKYYSIPLADYLSVSYEGIDGYGVATINFDQAAFNDKYSKRIEAAVEEGVEASELLSMSVSLSQYELLSNGDVIQLLIETDRNQFKRDYGYKLKYKSSTDVTVEGLSEVETYDPFENLSVSFNGANGYGYVEFNKISESGFLGEGRFVLQSVGEGLSNGDVITISYDDGWGEDPTNMIVQEYAKAPYPLSKDYTVTGLGEQDSFDAFSYVDIAFSGLNGYGEAEISITGEIPEDLEFRLDKEDDLSNGDIVTLSLTDRWGEDPTELCLSTLGLNPTELSKKYTVEGLGEYITDPANIDETEIELVKNQANDYLKAYITNDWSDEQKAVNTEYVGAYILNRKNGVTSGAVNTIIFVFCTDVEEYWDKTDTTYDYYYYWFLKYDDVSVNAAGEYSMNLMEYDLASNIAESRIENDRFYTYFRYKGYETLEELRTDFVDKNVERYTYVTTVDEDTLMAKDEAAIKARLGEKEEEEAEETTEE